MTIFLNSHHITRETVRSSLKSHAYTLLRAGRTLGTTVDGGVFFVQGNTRIWGSVEMKAVMEAVVINRQRRLSCVTGSTRAGTSDIHLCEMLTMTRSWLSGGTLK